MKQFEEPNKAEFLAALLMGKAKSEGRAALVPLSVRIPVWQLAQLDAMASKSGKSRNSMVALLFSAGFDAVLSHLDQKTIDELGRLEASRGLPATEDGETF